MRQGEGGKYMCIAGVETAGLDLRRVQGLVACNAFEISDRSSGAGSSGAGRTSGSGLFAVPSLFNHACAPNCDWVTVGDVMLIETASPIFKDEELLLSYNSPLAKHMLPPSEDRGTLSWGFECACGVCVRLAGCARECDAARHLLAQFVSPNDPRATQGTPLESPAKPGGTPLQLLTKKMRALSPSISVPDARAGGGEAQPHFASLLNMAAVAEAVRGGDAQAAALLRESIRICPPSGPASRHLVTCLGGYQTHRLLSLCLQNAGDAAGAREQEERARQCTIFAGSYALGVFASWARGELGEAEKGGSTLAAAMCRAEISALKSLGGLR